MKRFLFIAIAALVAAQAQDTAKPAPSAKDPRDYAIEPRYNTYKNVVKCDAAQLEKISAILEATSKKIAAISKDLDEEAQKTEARTILKKQHEEIDAVLTEEQIKVFRAHRAEARKKEAANEAKP